MEPREGVFMINETDSSNSFIGTIKRLATLSSQQRQILLRTLTYRELTFVGAKQLQKNLECDISLREVMLLWRTLGILRANLSELDLTDVDLKEVIREFFTVYHLEKEDVERLGENEIQSLQEFLGSVDEEPLVQLVNALIDHEVYISLRAAYAGNELSAANYIPIATLRLISESENGDTKSSYFQMEQADLESLQAELGKAKKRLEEMVKAGE